MRLFSPGQQGVAPALYPAAPAGLVTHEEVPHAERAGGVVAEREPQWGRHVQGNHLLQMHARRARMPDAA